MSCLVCPLDRSGLRASGQELVCARQGHACALRDGIPSFLPPADCRWDEYHLDRYGVDPLPPHPYYRRFTLGCERLLDVGSGDGVMSAASAPWAKQIFCLNPGLSALSALRRRGFPNMYPVHCYGEQTPFAEEFFDGVLSVFVIEHLADPRPMLQEMWRVLKPQGRLIMATDTAFYYRYLRPLLSYWHSREWKRNDPTHIHMMSPAGLRAVLRRSQFEIVEEDIHFSTGRTRRLLGWLPHFLYERWLTSMSVFVCRKR